MYSKTPPLWSPPSRGLSNFLRLFESGELGRHLRRRRGARSRAPPFCGPGRPCSRACAPTPTPTLRSRRSRPPCSRRSCASPTATSSPRQTCSRRRTAPRAQGRRPLRGHPAQAAGRDRARTPPLRGERRDLLLLADAHSCPQLKESATELFVSKAPEVMATAGWARLAAARPCSESWWLRASPPTSTRETTTTRGRGGPREADASLGAAQGARRRRPRHGRRARSARGGLREHPGADARAGARAERSRGRGGRARERGG